VRRAYGLAVGRHRTELVTPALVLDLPAAKRNIARLADRIQELPAEIRPHIKVHKSPALARLQVEAGAIGVSAPAPDRSTLALGDVVQLVPGYSPSTVNWYDAYYVVDNEVVVDVWPVIPRGPNHHGLVAG
jgi:D-serine deaminase-like pyridoxal phosphate-dependent protein